MTERFPAGTFAPDPGRGDTLTMLRAQGGLETRLALRNAEQVLLTLLIPAALLVGLTLIPALPSPEPRISWFLASMLALAVMSSAFTSQAIALGFDRRYGALRRLAATALPRWLLVCGRLVAVEGIGNSGVARLHVRDGSTVSGRRGFNAAVKPLPGFERKPAFEF